MTRQAMRSISAEGFVSSYQNSEILSLLQRKRKRYTCFLKHVTTFEKYKWIDLEINGDRKKIIIRSNDNFLLRMKVVVMFLLCLIMKIIVIMYYFSALKWKKLRKWNKSNILEWDQRIFLYFSSLKQVVVLHARIANSNITQPNNLKNATETCNIIL